MIARLAVARFTLEMLSKSLVLAFTVASLIVSPALAQIQPAQEAQNAQEAQDERQAQNQVVPGGAAQSQQDQSSGQTPAAQSGSADYTNPRDLSVTRGLDYSKGQPWF